MEAADYVLKILLVGDSNVGKSCLLMRFTTDQFEEQMVPTIGVDFKLKFVTLNGKRLKLTIWDTAGQERFRTLTSSYYRGAQGIIYTYDVTRRDSFEGLQEIWMKEVELYSTVENAVKMVVANKVDLDAKRQVSREQGQAFAQEHGCLFVETSAKTGTAVSQAFEELVLKILDTPSLLEQSPTAKLQPTSNAPRQQPSLCC